MTSNLQKAAEPLTTVWREPIVPEHYDRSPLTAEEWLALEQCLIDGSGHAMKKESITARRALARCDLPITDVFRLRYKGKCLDQLPQVQRIIRRQMYRFGKIFWEWTPQEWIEFLCPNAALFEARHGRYSCTHMPLMDAAYLLGRVTDLRPAGIERQISEAADTYFGAKLVAFQGNRLLSVLESKGFSQGKSSLKDIRQYLSMLFVLNRSPYLEDISEQLVAEVRSKSNKMRDVSRKITIGLQCLDILSPQPKKALSAPCTIENNGMANEWYQWCMVWYAQAVDLSPGVRKWYLLAVLAVGRWLHEHVPEIRTPEQWTETLALRFRADLCSWLSGQYASEGAQKRLKAKEKLGKPLQPEGIVSYLHALRRYFTDLIRKPHAVNGEPAHRIKLDFDPREVFTTPEHIKRALDAAEPRDIDLRVWAKLTIAAATLTQSDLPQGTRYPLSFYRALALVWVTSARRPNEITRLRLDCLREDWDPGMLNEDGLPVERNAGVDKEEADGKKVAKISYLHIPAGKNRGSFWIWLPDYAADAINRWKQERPSGQSTLLDQKDHEEVEYLFCFKDRRVGAAFLNQSLIPALLAKSGVDLKDAKGRITGHRGRRGELLGIVAEAHVSPY